MSHRHLALVRPGADLPTPPQHHASRWLVDLVRELRPDLPEVIAESLVVEALDRDPDEPTIDELAPDPTWAECREAAYPQCVRTARNTYEWFKRTGGG